MFKCMIKVCYAMFSRIPNINLSQQGKVLGYYKRGDFEITSITVQQFTHRWGQAK